MTRRGLRSALLPATVAATLAAVVLSATGGSAAAGRPARDAAAAPLRLTGLNLAAARAPFFHPTFGGRAAAATAATCDAASGVTCSDVVVPLDRAGRVPGTITLHVESLPAEAAQRGVMMLVAGGPGQGSASVFNLSDKNSAELYHVLFPGYRIVAFDNRGTGKSGLLLCSALQQSTTFVGQDALAAGCAATIGPNRDFYSTHDHADDTEAVRVALGVDKIALWGTSYGTKLALAYALAYPTHVERLLLDSVLPTEYPEPLEMNVLHDMPLALSGYCAGGVCRAATPNLAAEVAAVANALAAKPARGPVRLANGKVRNERMDGLDMLALVVDSDLNPGLAAALPAATHAARLGKMGALLRLHYLDLGGSSYTAEALSVGLNAATSCADGHFPWDPAAPLTDRPAKLAAAIAALPAGALGPFGPWATQLGTAAFCVRWPSPTVATPPLGAGPLPDVPVLSLSGGYDMRTPTSSAAAVTRLFPHGKLLVVPGIGHSVVGADNSFCAIKAVRSWVTDGNVPATCQRPYLIVTPPGAYPPTAVPAKAASPRATLVLARKTIKEAEAMWLTTAYGTGGPVGGLFAGKMTPGLNAFRLDRYSVAPGVELTGRLDAAGSGFPLSFKGTLTVSGNKAAHGKVTLKKDILTGTLGGIKVS
jgi:pimeloyl-ACP methyl ester carboxylesterase